MVTESSLSQPDNLQSELNHVRHSLQNNGYKKRDITNTINRHLNPHPRNPKTVTSNSVAFLPYIPGITDRINKILRKSGIKTVFKPPSKIGHLLPSPKDKLNPLSSKGVYTIPCSCGAQYIGETGRSIKTRISEHRRCLQTGLLSHSAVAEHQHNTGHQILFDNSSLIAQSPYYYTRKIRESVEIAKRPHNLNRDTGFPLSSVWHPVLRPAPHSAASPTGINTSAKLPLIVD